MPHKATALFKHLLQDLSCVLDEDQLAMISRPDSKFWPDASLTEARCFMLGKSLVKKYNPKDDPSTDAKAAALSKFHEGNDKCRDWQYVPEYSRDDELVNELKKVIDEFWHPWYKSCDGTTPLVSSLNEVHKFGRLGRGANRLCRGYDLYTKLFDSPLSTTSDGLAYTYAKLSSEDPRWAAAEKHRRNRHGTVIVEGNKLGFVNKNVDVARCTSTEPTINMWYQLGFGAILEAGLRASFGINLSTQPEVNQDLARRGSSSGRLVTIDLENASNSLANRMIRHVLPKSFSDWLWLLRSPKTELPDGRCTDLHMVATMGNGFCFPLQTMLFAASVVTVYRYLGIKPEHHGPADARNYGVFGDDIICVAEAAPLVLRLLGVLGFTANADKTFVEGPFRESCGGDYFNGHPCRGVYVKTLRNKQAIWVAVNALNRWTAVSGVVLPRTVRYLLSLSGPYHTVPFDEADDAGVHVPLGRHAGHHLKHGIVSYHKSVAVSMQLTVGPDSIVLEKRSVDVARKKRQKIANRHYNDDALVLCFLRGNIREYMITLRQRNPLYTTRRRVSPCWDTLPPELSRAYNVTGPRLIDAVEWNIFTPF